VYVGSVGRNKDKRRVVYYSSNCMIEARNMKVDWPRRVWVLDCSVNVNEVT
jgi:hypothetical protein